MVAASESYSPYPSTNITLHRLTGLDSTAVNIDATGSQFTTWFSWDNSLNTSNDVSLKFYDVAAPTVGGANTPDDDPELVWVCEAGTTGSVMVMGDAVDGMATHFTAAACLEHGQATAPVTNPPSSFTFELEIDS